MSTAWLAEDVMHAGTQIVATLAGDTDLLAAQPLRCIFAPPRSASPAAAHSPISAPAPAPAGPAAVAVKASAYAARNVSAASVQCTAPAGYLGASFSIAVLTDPEASFRSDLVL